MRFFSYCPECGFDMYAEMAEAKKSAENHLAHFREDAAEDGWLDDVEATCWGEIKGAVEKGPEMTPCEFFGCDGSCDGHHVFDVYCNYKCEFFGCDGSCNGHHVFDVYCNYKLVGVE